MHKSIVYSARYCTEVSGQLQAFSALPAEEYPSRYPHNGLSRCFEREHSFVLSWTKPRFLGRPATYRLSPGATRSFQTLFIALRSAGCRKYIISSLYLEVTFVQLDVSVSNLTPMYLLYGTYRRRPFPEFNRVACWSCFNVSAYISVAIFRINEVERAVKRYSLWSSLWVWGLGWGNRCFAVGRNRVIKTECWRQRVGVGIYSGWIYVFI